MQRRLRAIGRTRVVVLDAWQRYPLGEDLDDWLVVIPEQCPMSHDSAVLIKVAGRSVLHTNDARISLAQTRRAMAEVGAPFAIEAAWAANPPATPGLAERFKAHFESLGTLSEYFLARIGMTVRFEVGARAGESGMPTSAPTATTTTWWAY